MSMPATWSWLVAGYSLALLICGWCFDIMARRTSEKAAQWRNGNFIYHKNKDAWKCPQGQWLLPTEFDPETRVMQYRADPAICNVCPAKNTCTTSISGRGITRATDPWPHSETGRFHRGIACAVASFGIILPIVSLPINHNTGDITLLLATIILVIAGTYPLLRHLWNTPANAPDENPAHLTTTETT